MGGIATEPHDGVRRVDGPVGAIAVDAALDAFLVAALK
jgi:hypothetical protein